MNETVRLTYGELAKARGITLAAARRMTLRRKWPKQVGNDGLTRVSVPASALTRAESDGTGAGTVNTPGAGTGDVASEQPGRGKQVSCPRSDGTGDVTAVVWSLSEAIASLRAQLIRERERADRAENRADETEERVRELREKLEAEMTEHRRIVGLLAERFSARRSWWPWRR